MGIALAGLACAPALADPQKLPTPVAPVVVPVPLHPALWKVADADTTIYLFGTVHVMKPGPVWLEGPLAQALDASDELVTEIVDPAGSATQAALLARATLPKGRNLRAMMPKPQRDAFEAVLKKSSLPVDALDRFKPWYAGVVMASLPLIQQGLTAQSGAEAMLEARPAPHPRGHSGLETVDYQLKLFDSLPVKSQLAYLGSVVAEYDTIATQIDDLVKAWGAGDAEALAKAMNADMDDPKLVETLLTGRNRQWARWIRTRLATPGTVFVAVGAGHLAGKGSVQAQLTRLGITTTRVQ
jgi:uncharacterized protein YbaP (TraB family)